MAPPKIPIHKRLAARTRKEGECIVWTGHVTGYGYGSILQDGKQVRVHRVAYELAKGAIPSGLVIDHLCRNRRCVNPAHLEAVTERENILRGTSPSARHARKTHCDAGHPFDDTNTGIQAKGRFCRECARAKVRQFRSRQAAKRAA